MRLKIIILLLQILFFCHCISSAQEADSANTFSPNAVRRTVIHQKPGHVYSAVTMGDSVNVIDTDMTEVMDVIVEFKDDALFTPQQQKVQGKISLSGYQSRQAQLTNDLLRLHENSSRALSVSLSVPKKKREFHKLFSGASMSVPRGMLSDIASLPYVKKVHIDRKYKIDLSESVKIIGADAVWTKYNDLGDSVKIGILDTGIDYLHPALGGGFGKGFKVAGGYDFVNRDNDPMDDNGHGTHVAGIIAGNNEKIKGVAPNALLFVYKVLNRAGEGFESNILSGIEATVDPDNDNDFSDKLDVVNMSLGDKGGDPNDPLNEAINNAVKLGVTYCVAAGNDGMYNKIYSPGTAELAITVGSTEKSDQISLFSSKGPTKKSYIIKPEILAPGSGIYSCVPGMGYNYGSGTSMATPHVAGVCALLKHMHKDWTPEMIKSAIVSSAKELGLDIMTQGAGRLDALRAMSVTSFAIPSVLSYGLDTAAADIWEKADTVKILNKSVFLQNYSVSVSGLTPGISLNADKNNFTLQPGESGRIVFTLSVDKSVPYLSKDSYSYSGNVRIYGNKDTLRLPWAFVKAPVLQISFEKPVSFFCVFGGYKSYTNEDAWNSYDPYLSELMLPADNYQIFASFWHNNNGIYERRLVSKINVPVNGFKKISLNPEEADKTITFHGVDEAGREMNSYNNVTTNIHFVYPWNSKTQYLGLYYLVDQGQVIKTSFLPANLAIYAGQFQFDLKRDPTVRIIQFRGIGGIQENTEFKNDPLDFVKRNINITQFPDGNSEAGFYSTMRYPNGTIDFLDYSQRIKDIKWKGKLYMTRDPGNGYGLTAKAFSRDRSTGKDNWISGTFGATNNSIFNVPYRYYLGSTYYYNENQEISLGDGPISPLFSVRYCPCNSKTVSSISYYGQLYEERMLTNRHSLYTIYDRSNQIVRTDSLVYDNVFDLPQGRYKHELITDNYAVAGVWGKARLLSDADIYTDGFHLPQISNIKIMNQYGSPVSILNKGEEAIIAFTVDSYKTVDYLNICDLDTLRTLLYLKKNGTPDWEKVKIKRRYISDIVRVTSVAGIGRFTSEDSTLIDLKIVARNPVSSVEWVLVPAFAVGDYKYKSIDENDYTFRLPTPDYVLYNNFPNPFNSMTTISYGLPRRSHVDIRIYDMLGQETAKLVDWEQDAGQYKIEFNAAGLSSGIYFCRMSAGGYSRTQKIMLVK